MPDDPINLVRIQETGQAIDALDRLLTSWLDRRAKKDTRKQYKTLLSTLQTQLVALLDEVRLSMKPVSASSNRGDVYAACRLNDKRLLWIERLWVYFKDKFDQREDPVYGPLLAAADEVVWSCYAAPFRETGAAHGAAPLPWVAAEYSPKALARSRVPQDLQNDVDGEFLSKMLEELPVPLVNIPPNCTREPWWLVYLAHEVGHHVQYDLLPKQKLVDDFREIVKSAIGDEDAAERWQYRGEEIFADVFSMYMTGPWALWALTELVWTKDAAMIVDDQALYPSPAARLMLMSHVLDDLGFDGATARRNFPSAAILDAAPGDAAIVAAIAKTVMSRALVGGKTFADLCRWNPSEHQGPTAAVGEWIETFLRDGSRQADEALSAARLAVAGGVAAWAEVSTETDAQTRVTLQERLARDLVVALRNSHEPVERAAQSEPAAASTSSRQLVSLLFQSDAARLGAW